MRLKKHTVTKKTEVVDSVLTFSTQNRGISIQEF